MYVVNDIHNSRNSKCEHSLASLGTVDVYGTDLADSPRRGSPDLPCLSRPGPCFSRAEHCVSLLNCDYPDITIVIHMPSLPGSPSTILTGSKVILCTLAEKGEPGNEATCTHVYKYMYIHVYKVLFVHVRAHQYINLNKHK